MLVVSDELSAARLAARAGVSEVEVERLIRAGVLGRAKARRRFVHPTCRRSASP